MKVNILTTLVLGTLLSIALSACDSEKEIEKTPDDHELFSTRKTKNDSTLKNPNTIDSILHTDTSSVPR